MDRCAQRNGERGNGIGHAILTGLSQGDRNRRCRRGSSQGGQVRRKHGEESLEGVDASNGASNEVLGQQNDNFKDEHDHDDADERAHDVHCFTGVGQVQENTEDVQGKQRNDDVLDQAGDDRTELNEALAQNAPGHQGQPNSNDEGQQECGHHTNDRRHFDGEVGLEDFLRSFYLSQLPNKNLREEVCAYTVGQEACEHRRGVGERCGKPQPVAGPLTEVRDCRGH